MVANYYKLLYRLDGTERFLLWFTNGKDGVVTDSDGFVPSFATADEVCSFADCLDVGISDEAPILHDLDPVRNWLDDPRSDGVDCKAVLDAWNLFGDVARSVSRGAAFLKADEALGDVYDKLFRGNNIPVMTPEGETYKPVWTPAEVSELADLLQAGFELFRRVVLNTA